MAAEVMIELAHPASGKTHRIICKACRKVAFSNEASAQAAVERISKRVKMECYPGKLKRTSEWGKRGDPCGWWHLSRIEREHKRRR